MAAKRATWIAGAGFVGVVALAGTWFLGISPVLDETAQIHEQHETVEAQNMVLEARLQQLSADSAKLPELKAELAQLQVGIPTTAQVDDFLRRVDEIQVARQIPTVSVEVGDPLSVVDNRGVLQSTPAPTPAPEATGSPTPEPTASADGTTDTSASGSSSSNGTAAVAGPEGFVAVPVTITVLGNFVSSLGFISDLQSGDGRLFLITELTGLGQGDAEAVDGRPATVRGDVELTITGNLYVLVDTTGLTAPEQDGSLPSVDPAKPSLDAGA